MVWVYPVSLAILSALVMLAERLWPWRKDQRQLRRWLWSDLVQLVFNGHFLGVILYGVSARFVIPHLDGALDQLGLRGAVYRGAASSWPVWLQIIVALFAVDFVHWCVHNLLHRVPIFWDLHKAHHSVTDGEMDFIVSFRFQWTEVVLYKTVQYLPLAFFGFGVEAVLFHAIFGTLIGHLNHANLDLDYGPLRYLLNNPRMHIWHHNHDVEGKGTKNFGIIFSCWDYIFRTASVPGEAPRRIGFSGDETFPRSFFGQAIWPIQRLFPAANPDGPVASLLGIGLIASAWWLAR